MKMRLLTVVCRFDLSTAEVYKTSEATWNARYGYELMARAFYCKELTGFTTEELHEYLAHAERAEQSACYDEAELAQLLADQLQKAGLTKNNREIYQFQRPTV